MSLFFQIGETVNSKFIFKDPVTKEPVNINSPTYRIVHYEHMNEVIDVNETTLSQVPGRIGEYIVSWLIPGTVIEDETYFIYASGIYPIQLTVTEQQDSFKIVPSNYFQNGTSSGLTIQFSAPC